MAKDSDNLNKLYVEAVRPDVWQFGGPHPDSDRPEFDKDMRDDTRFGGGGAARRLVTVTIYDKEKGYRSTLHLDSSHYDNIGWTKRSLDEYLKEYILGPNQWYTTSRDRVERIRRRR